ncbi:MAG: XrtA/PEP-CTERM system TPR-repeat protein PrsT [Pseudomonadota bacterium]
MTKATPNTFRHLLMATAAACFFAGTTIAPVTPAFAVDVQKSETYVEKARGHFARGEIREAQIELRNALRENPKNGNASLLLADIYLEYSQGIAAQTEVENARQYGIGENETRVRMARSLLLQGQFDNALEELNLEEIPLDDLPMAYRFRGASFAGQRDLEKAEENYVKALELDPQYVDVMVDLSRLYGRQRKFEDATKMVDNALSIEPENTLALNVKGDMTRSLVGLEEALPFFNRAIEADPSYLPARLERAATLIDLRRGEEAKDDLDLVFKAAPDNSLAIYLTAVLESRSGNYEEANGLMNRTGTRLDDYPPAALLRGAIAYQLGDLEQAQQRLTKLLQKVPNSIAGRKLLGATLIKNGQYADAINQLQPLVEGGLEDTALYTLLGTAYAQTGQFEKSMQYFEGAVAKAPDKTGLRSQLAMSQVALGDPGAAREELNAVLDVDQDSLQALVLLTILDMRGGNYEGAKGTAARLRDAYPKLALGYNLLGAAEVGLGKPKEAEALFKESIERDGNYFEARRNLARLYRVQGRYDEARRQFLRILDTQRADGETMLELAELARIQDNKEEMIDWLRKTVAAQPNELAPRLKLVDAYLALGDRQKGLDEALSVDRDFPDNIRAMERLGKAYALLEDFERSESTFARMARLRPDSLQAQWYLGRAQWLGGDIRAARRTFNNALRVRENDPRANHGPILRDLMSMEAQEKQFDVALSYASRLRAEYPNQNVADITIAGLHMGAENWTSAIKSYEAAKAVEFSKSIAINMSTAYVKLGDFDKASGVLNEWLKEEPDDVITELRLAEIRTAAEDYDAALTMYENLLQRTDESPAILNNMAWIYQQQGDSRALEVGERAYELSPDSPQIADTLGWILVERGIDIKRGLLLLQTASQALPDDPTIRYHLAYALNENGRTDAARRELEDLLEKNRDFSRARDARDLLKRISAG